MTQRGKVYQNSVEIHDNIMTLGKISESCLEDLSIV